MLGLHLNQRPVFSLDLFVSNSYLPEESVKEKRAVAQIILVRVLGLIYKYGKDNK
jgi:hypothetical protein